jgi:hypothetical protein
MTPSQTPRQLESYHCAPHVPVPVPAAVMMPVAVWVLELELKSRVHSRRTASQGSSATRPAELQDTGTAKTLPQSSDDHLQLSLSFVWLRISLLEPY